MFVPINAHFHFTSICYVIKIIRRNQMGGREKNLMGNELKEGAYIEMDPYVNFKVRSTCLTSDK